MWRAGGWWRTGYSPIGLDIGTMGVRMVQLAATGSVNCRVTGAASRELPGDLPESGPTREAVVADAVADMLRTGEFAGRQVVSSMPATDVEYKNLRLPPMPSDELSAAVAWEAAERFQMGPGEAQIAFLDAGEVRQGEELREEIILLAARREAVKRHVDLLGQVGLKPIAIDAPPTALARVAPPNNPQDLNEPAVVVVDLGHAASKVLMVRQGRPLFFKLIAPGAAALRPSPAHQAAAASERAAGLHPALQGEASAEPQEDAADRASRFASELGREIGLCLRYYSVTFRGPRPEAAWACGGLASRSDLLDRIGQVADIRLKPLDPLADKSHRLTDSDPAPATWAIACGLAQRESARNARKRGAA